MFKKLNDIRAKKGNKKGFTLVELIVVIVIILILAAVLVPNVMKYVDQARQSAAQAEAAAILVVVQGEEAEAWSKDGLDLGDTGCTITPTYEMTDGAAGNGTVTYTVEKGEVLSFVYEDNAYTVTYTPATGKWVIS